MADENVYNTFVRQRRNFIIISLVLTFVLAGKATFPELNILGNKIKLSDPNILANSLIVGWIYFMYRYGVYFLDVDDNIFRSSYYSWLQYFIEKRILLKTNHLPNLTKQVNIYEQKSNAYSGKVKLDKVDQFKGPFETEMYTVDGVILRCYQLRSFLKAVFFTRYFSEYMLPFVIGVIPIPYLLVTAFL